MKKYSISIVYVGILLFLYGPADATTWYVHPDSALSLIQAGIDSSGAGDTVLVGPGTYTENINFDGKAITVTSELGRDTTIIDGGTPTNPDSGSVVVFVSGEDTTSILEGFTITNGSGTYDPWWGYLGGGIYCDNSSPIIESNTITGNSVTWGGGISCNNGSSPEIIDNIISANTASSSSGGIDLYANCSPTIMGNTITGNNAGSAGGGIQCYDNCYPLIIANTITNDTAATWGGGIRVSLNSSPLIRDNYIEGNDAFDGGGIECDGNGVAPLIVHNTITNNTASNWGGGIECEFNATPTIDSCTISNNSGDGIYCANGGNPIIHYSDIVDNEGYAVFNADPSVTINAINNWWGDAAGPYHATNPGGLGDTVSDYVDFDPWLLEPVYPGIEEHESSQRFVTNLQISPNPFRDRINIRWQMSGEADITKTSVISVKIYDATGRLVKTFSVPSSYSLAPSVISWNGVDDADRKLPSGVYFLKVQAGDCSATEKLLLIR